MTQTYVIPKILYQNTTGTYFPFGFRILAASDLVVTKLDLLNTPTVLSLGVDYTVSGAGQYSGGGVTLAADLGGYTLMIERQIPLTQPTSLANEGAFFPATVEMAMDRLTMQVQQVAEAQSRSLTLAPNTLNGDGAVPTPADGYVLGWVNGKLANLSAASASLAADLLSAAVGMGDSLITVTSSLTGAVARLLHNKLTDSLNPKDFGVKGDGATDDAPALNTFFANMAAGVYGTCKRVVFPYGRYKIGSTVTIPPFTNVNMNPDQRSCDLSDWEIDFGRASFLCACANPFALTALNPAVAAGSFVVGQAYMITFHGTTDFTLIGAANNNIGTTFTATGVGTGTGTASGPGVYPYIRYHTYIHGGSFVPYGAQAVTAVFAMTGSSYWQTTFQRIQCNRMSPGSIGALISYYNDSITFQAGMLTVKDCFGFYCGNVISFSASAASIAAGTNTVDNFVLENVYHQTINATDAVVKLASFNLISPTFDHVVVTGPGTFVDGLGNYLIQGILRNLYWEPTGTVAQNAFSVHFANVTMAHCKAYFSSATAQALIRWYVGSATKSTFDNVHLDCTAPNVGHPYTFGTYVFMYIDVGTDNNYIGYTNVEMKQGFSLANPKRYGTVVGVSDTVAMADSIVPSGAGVAANTTTTLITAPGKLESLVAVGASGMLRVRVRGYKTNAATCTLQYNLVIGAQVIPIGGPILQGVGNFEADADIAFSPAGGNNLSIIPSGLAYNQAMAPTRGTFNRLNIEGTWWAADATTSAVSLQLVTTGWTAGTVYTTHATVERVGRGIGIQVNA